MAEIALEPDAAAFLAKLPTDVRAPTVYPHLDGE